MPIRENMMASDYTWFVFPKNSHTNEVISRFVEEGTSGFETETANIRCEDGRPRRMWRGSRQDIQALWDSREDQRLKLAVFNQQGHGKVRDVTLTFTDNFKKGKRAKRLRARTQKKLF